MQLTVSVPEHNINKFQQRLNRVNNRCLRLGVLPFVVVKEQEVQRPKRVQYEGRWCDVQTLYREYTIQGDPPLVPGYKVLGTIDAVTGVYRSWNAQVAISPKILEGDLQECHHCWTNRQRTLSFVLVDEETETQILVGSSCVEDFINAHIAQLLRGWARVVNRMCDQDYENDSTMDPSNWLWPVSHAVYISLGMIRKHGFLSSRNQVSTASQTASALLWGQVQGLTTNAHQGMANWLNATSRNHEILDRCRAMLGSGWVRHCDLPSLVAGVNIWWQDSNQSQQPSNHVGKMDQKWEGKSRLERVISLPDRGYGPKKLYRWRDQQGNVLTWITSVMLQLTVGQQYNLKGTVKRHQEYNGEKQTVLTRCRVDRSEN